MRFKKKLAVALALEECLALVAPTVQQRLVVVSLVVLYLEVVPSLDSQALLLELLKRSCQIASLMKWRPIMKK